MIKIYIQYQYIHNFIKWYEKYKSLFTYGIISIQDHTKNIPCGYSLTDKKDNVELLIPMEHYLHITETLDEYNNQGV